MFLTALQLFPRRFLNSPHHCFRRPPRHHSKFMTRERVYRFTGWLYSDARDKWRSATQFLAHAWKRQTKTRQDAAMLEKWFYKRRLTGALDEHRMTLPIFQEMLEKLNIKLNLQMLSFLAIYEPASFKSLAMMTRQMALNEGLNVSPKEPTPENVVLPIKF